MKYLISYNEHRLNEGIFGDILNWFKGLWTKFAADMQKLEDDPNKIKEYINTKVIPTIINKEVDKFKETVTKAPKTAPTQSGTVSSTLASYNYDLKYVPIYEADATTPANKASDGDVFNLIDGILNKDNGLLGTKGIGVLFNDKSLQGDKMKTKRLSFEYIITTARDQISKNIKYDQKHNIDRNENGEGFVDKTYLPTLKEVMIKNDNNLDVIIGWVKTNITDALIGAVKATREDDIKAAVAKGGVQADYKVGDNVRYKMKTFVEGTEPDKQKNNIGTKKIDKIEGDKYYFTDTKGVAFTKTKDQIIDKVEGDETSGNDAENLKTELGKIKANPQMMKDVLDFVKFKEDPNNKNKPYTTPEVK